jgi:hypothetical protein
VRTTIAAIGAALLTTLGLAAWQTRSDAEARAPLALGAQQPWATRAAQAQPGGAALAGMPEQPTVISCAPGQQAVVGQSLVDGRVVTRADCVWMAAQPALATPAGYAATGYAQPAADIVEYRPQPRAVRYVEEPGRRRVASKPKRSWQKSALVIGGAAGAGAGIGALTGGKKGALIGAAIGGGAGSIYEAVKRK